MRRAPDFHAPSPCHWLPRPRTPPSIRSAHVAQQACAIHRQKMDTSRCCHGHREHRMMRYSQNSTADGQRRALELSLGKAIRTTNMAASISKDTTIECPSAHRCENTRLIKLEKRSSLPHWSCTLKAHGCAKLKTRATESVAEITTHFREY